MTMVVMVGMPTRHLKNCDVERVFVIFFELQNVLASFHVENRDICVSGTIRRILDDLLRLCMAVVVVAFGVLTHGDRWSGSGGEDTLWLSTAGIAATWLAAGTLGATLLRHQTEVLLSR